MVDKPRQDILNTEPMDLSPKGQRMQLTVVRTAESWQFFAFVFAALLTLAYGVMEDLLDGATWRWWRLGLRVGLFIVFGYVLMLNVWARERLVRLMDWMKRESELLP